MDATHYRFTRFRVRYGETDKMGVVYNANYLNWFEIGRTDFIRASGCSYRELEERGILLPLTDAQLSFLAPARYDDEVEVRTRVIELTPVRLTFSYEICRVADGKLLVRGETRHVFTDAELKPIRLPRREPELYDWLAAEERRCNGEPVTEHSR